MSPPNVKQINKDVEDILKTISAYESIKETGPDRLEFLTNELSTSNGSLSEERRATIEYSIDVLPEQISEAKRALPGLYSRLNCMKIIQDGASNYTP